MDLAAVLSEIFKKQQEVISNEIFSAFWKAFRLGTNGSRMLREVSEGSLLDRVSRCPYLSPLVKPNLNLSGNRHHGNQ